jgi:hypothetical protein
MFSNDKSTSVSTVTLTDSATTIIEIYPEQKEK